MNLLMIFSWASSFTFSLLAARFRVKVFMFLAL